MYPTHRVNQERRTLISRFIEHLSRLTGAVRSSRGMGSARLKDPGFGGDDGRKEERQRSILVIEVS